MKIKYVGKCLLVEENGKKILAVGDLHFGYEEGLNKSGVFVSGKIYNELIEELDKIFKRLGREGKKVDKVVLLGDVKHGFGKIFRQERENILGLIEYLKGKVENGQVVIVRGNHDKIIEVIVGKKDVEIKDYYVVGDVCFLHGDVTFDEVERKEIKLWVMGHGHPAVKLSDGVKIEKYKCFLVGKFHGKKIIVVPSFFEGNIGSDPRENDLGLAWDFDLGKFEVKIVSENLEVLEFGKLEKLD